MKARKAFRILLVSFWLTVVAYLAASIFSEKYLPPELNAYNAQVAAREEPLLVNLALTAYGLGLVGLLIATIMLFNFKPGARHYFAGFHVVSWLLDFFLGHTVEHQWAFPFLELHFFLGGAIVAMCYFGGIFEDRLTEVGRVFE